MQGDISNLREEVITELTKRVLALEDIAKPNDIATGMSGSFFHFNYHIQSHTAMTDEEFHSCIYDDWIRDRHREIFEAVNGRSFDSPRTLENAG